MTYKTRTTYPETRERKPTYPGESEKIEYLMQIDKTGHKYLVENGRTNTYEKIQAEAEGRDINSMIEKATRGDTSVIDFNKVYGDATEIPKDMLQFQNLRLRVEDTWNKLPLEIRKAYDNDIDIYMADFGSEKWLKLHGYETEKEAAPIAAEKETADE